MFICKTVSNPGVTVLGEDVVYAKRTVFDLKALQTVSVDLKMDIIAPPNANNNAPQRPLIIYFHGKNQIDYNNKACETYKYNRDAHDHLILKFAREHNCVVAFVDYISGPLKWEDAALAFQKSVKCGGTPLYDAIEEKRNIYFMVSQGKEAVRFLKSKQNEYHFDPENITVAGFSAGGTIAAGVGFMNDPAFYPSYAKAQPDVRYDQANKFPNDVVNLAIHCININSNLSYGQMPNTFAVPIPRPDLGSIEGANPSRYNSKVKNVVLLNSAIKDPVNISQVGPRLFIYGNDEDETLADLQKNASEPCSNSAPLLIFNAIRRQAESVGYQQNVNLKTIQARDPGHDYKHYDLIGGYPNVIEAIWDFID